jgi:hypothetical protein
VALAVDGRQQGRHRAYSRGTRARFQ